jgi:hypothetical protein
MPVFMPAGLTCGKAFGQAWQAPESHLPLSKVKKKKEERDM